MRLPRVWFPVAVLVAGSVGLCLAAQSCLGQGTEAGAWKTVTPERLSLSEAGAVRAAAERYYALMCGASPSSALDLLSEPAREEVGPGVMFDPSRERVVKVDWIGEPFLAAADVVQVRADVTRTPIDEKRAPWRHLDTLSFSRSDSEHRIWLSGSATKGVYYLPVDTVNAFWKGYPILGGKQADMKLLVVSRVSPRWPGWSDDPEALSALLREWFNYEAATYGPVLPGADAWRTSAAYVGPAGKDALVERTVRFGNEHGASTAVTYRFLVAAEETNPFDAAGGAHPSVINTWRIADACRVKSEQVQVSR